MATKSNKKNENGHDELKWPYGKKNYLVFAVALIVIAIGFFTLSKGSETLGPVLLVVGYVVLVPIALLIKDSDVVAVETAESDSSK